MTAGTTHSNGAAGKPRPAWAPVRGRSAAPDLSARDPLAAADPPRNPGDHTSPVAAALEEAWSDHLQGRDEDEPRDDELPGAPAHTALRRQMLEDARRIGPADPTNRRTPDEIDTMVTLALVGRRRQREADRVRVAAASGGIDAADLLALELPPLRWVVPELLPAGTAIIAAPPKVGKSCLVYQVAVEVAIGGELLGRRVMPGSALYLALEDGQRRGQDRLRAALAGRTMPRGRLEVRWSARKTGAGLEDDLAAWLDVHPDAAFVAIDTLGKVRSRTDGRRNAYEVDVEDLGRLQNLFRDRDVALVIVHHAKKDAGDDFLASVSGTYGVTGSADTIIAIKRKRLEPFGSILVTGRDVADAEVSVRFDGMTWSSAPPAIAEASFERIQVLSVIAESGPIFPAGIARILGLERTSVQHMVGGLADAGAVVRTPKGWAATEGARANLSPNHSTHSESGDSDLGHARAGARVSDRMAAIFEDHPYEVEDPGDADELDVGPIVRPLFADPPAATA